VRQSPSWVFILNRYSFFSDYATDKRQGGCSASSSGYDDNIVESSGLLRNLIQRELDAGIPSERILLAGFSQGGAIILHTALRYEKPLAGILALSTYLLHRGILGSRTQ
jgi:phospholipase/carboxylesterase